MLLWVMEVLVDLQLVSWTLLLLSTTLLGVMVSVTTTECLNRFVPLSFILHSFFY